VVGDVETRSRSRSRGPRAGTGSSPDRSTDTTWSVGWRSSTPEAAGSRWCGSSRSSRRASRARACVRRRTRATACCRKPAHRRRLSRRCGSSPAWRGRRTPPERIPVTVGEVRYLVLRIRVGVDAAKAERMRATLRRRRRRGPTTEGSPWGTCDRRTLPGSPPSRRCRWWRTATSGSGRRRRRSADHRSPRRWGTRSARRSLLVHHREAAPRRTPRGRRRSRAS
jgi:hypothetical protein